MNIRLSTDFSQMSVPYKWVLSRSDQHCAECLSLAGQVRTLNHWLQTVVPGTAQCGRQCGCKLVATTEQPSLYPGEHFNIDQAHNFHWSGGSGSNRVEEPEPDVMQPVNPNARPMRAR